MLEQADRIRAAAANTNSFFIMDFFHLLEQRVFRRPLLMGSSERLCHGTDIGKFTVYRGGCRHSGTDKVCAPAVALAAFEVAVGSGGAALARSEAVGVHGEAH